MLAVVSCTLRSQAMHSHASTLPNWGWNGDLRLNGCEREMNWARGKVVGEAKGAKGRLAEVGYRRERNCGRREWFGLAIVHTVPPRAGVGAERKAGKLAGFEGLWLRWECTRVDSFFSHLVVFSFGCVSFVCFLFALFILVSIGGMFSSGRIGIGWFLKVMLGNWVVCPLVILAN